MSTATVDTVEAGYEALFLSFHRAAAGTALKCFTKGDQYGTTLAEARAEVYGQCAELVKKMPAAEGALEMMSRARAGHIRTPPMMNFDSAGVQFVIARAYQFCAWKIEPSLPEVAKTWD